MDVPTMPAPSTINRCEPGEPPLQQIFVALSYAHARPGLQGPAQITTDKYVRPVRRYERRRAPDNAQPSAIYLSVAACTASSVCKVCGSKRGNVPADVDVVLTLGGVAAVADDVLLFCGPVVANDCDGASPCAAVLCDCPRFHNVWACTYGLLPFDAPTVDMARSWKHRPHDGCSRPANRDAKPGPMRKWPRNNGFSGGMSAEAKSKASHCCRCRQMLPGRGTVRCPSKHGVLREPRPQKTVQFR